MEFPNNKLSKDEADYDRLGTTAPKGERCKMCEWFCGDNKPCHGLFGKTQGESWCSQFKLRPVVVLELYGGA